MEGGRRVAANVRSWNKRIYRKLHSDGTRRRNPFIPSMRVNEEARFGGMKSKNKGGLRFFAFDHVFTSRHNRDLRSARPVFPAASAAVAHVVGLGLSAFAAGWGGAGLVALGGGVFYRWKRRSRPEILVVEGWVGRDSLREALAEYQRGGYRLLVTAGGDTGADWRTRSWNYAELAAAELTRLGLAEEQLVAAPARSHQGSRTQASAQAVREALAARGEVPGSINVWTRGVHARRSRLIFARVFGSRTRVGVLAWKPAETVGPWWKSGDRARDFLEETLGYLRARVWL